MLVARRFATLPIWILWVLYLCPPELSPRGKKLQVHFFPPTRRSWARTQNIPGTARVSHSTLFVDAVLSTLKIDSAGPPEDPPLQKSLLIWKTPPPIPAFVGAATLLAYAGLKRLDMAHVATSVLNQDVRFHGMG